MYNATKKIHVISRVSQDCDGKNLCGHRFNEVHVSQSVWELCSLLIRQTAVVTTHGANLLRAAASAHHRNHSRPSQLLLLLLLLLDGGGSY